MRTSIFYLVFSFLLSSFYSCEKAETQIPSALQDIEMTKYFENEIFTGEDLKIYGNWEIFNISGGIHGGGTDLNFDYLAIKNYGIYGFVRNDSLLEYGRIVPVIQPANETGLQVSFEKDADSPSFFEDRLKYVVFSGNDTLNLIAPCCDRYNYHFERIHFD